MQGQFAERYMQGLMSLFSKSSLFLNNYVQEAKALEEFYTDKHKLPSKIHLNEEENAAYDANRLEYICRALDFICKWHLSGKPKIEGLSEIEQEAYEVWGVLHNCRLLIEHIGFTIYHLSGALRAKYKHLLGPKPFIWETFEQLGGLMKVAPKEWMAFIIRDMPGEIAQRFINESQEKEKIVEAAIQTIIDVDIPKLRDLFLQIQNCEFGGIHDSKVSPVNLIAIKALVGRILDTETLDQLLKYADNHCNRAPHRDILDQAKRKAKDGQLYMIEFKDEDKRFEREINLSTKIGRHAALRRLEKIGELLTGKNFSSFLKYLDTSIDWQAFITVRDVIAHQDVGANKAKVDLLLENKDQFLAILHDEMTFLFKKLCGLIVKRDESLPKFNVDDIDGFWQQIYQYERNKHQQAVNKSKNRVSKEDTAQFIKILKQHDVSAEIQCKWLQVFNGKAAIPEGKERGELLRSLPSRKQYPELYEQCKQIADQAFGIKINKISKEMQMQQEQEEAKKREEERELNFVGFEHLRTLAKSWASKSSSLPTLTGEQRVDAAIAALENIKEFMEQDEFVCANFNFASLKDWENAQQQDQAMNFFARLLSKPEFNDAIEYNAAQLLQHLDTIRDFPEAQNSRCRFLEHDYEAMRYLRNWAEHGNALFDKEDYHPEQEPSLLSDLQKKIGPIMITLIFELLPVLKLIKQKVAFRQVSRSINTLVNVQLQEAFHRQPGTSTDQNFDDAQILNRINNLCFWHFQRGLTQTSTEPTSKVQIVDL